MKKIVLLLALILLAGTLLSCSTPRVAATPNLSQIRSICNLATLECYYHNVAKSVKEAGSGLSHLGETDRAFWIEYTGIAKIGIDMSEVHMTVEGEHVAVFIPNAKLLSIDISETDLNESSYISSGDSWFNKNKITAEDQTNAIHEAQQKMAESVRNNTALLLNAQDRAKDLIENYILQLGELSGIKYVIEWQYEDVSAQP